METEQPIQLYRRGPSTWKVRLGTTEIDTGQKLKSAAVRMARKMFANSDVPALKKLVPAPASAPRAPRAPSPSLAPSRPDPFVPFKLVAAVIESLPLDRIVPTLQEALARYAVEPHRKIAAALQNLPDPQAVELLGVFLTIYQKSYHQNGVTPA